MDTDNQTDEGRVFIAILFFSLFFSRIPKILKFVLIVENTLYLSYRIKLHFNRLILFYSLVMSNYLPNLCCQDVRERKDSGNHFHDFQILRSGLK